MIMKPEPIFKAVETVLSETGSKPKIILLSPQGKRFDQDMAKTLSKEEHILLICGHYGGVDERVKLGLVDEEISIGDYVLTGGELPAMVIIDAIVRIIPGVLGAEESIHKDTFYNWLLSPPEYTRPRCFREMEVPSILLSGNHKRIEKWRRFQAIKRTLERRPELLRKVRLSDGDKEIIERLKRGLKDEY